MHVNIQLYCEMMISVLMINKLGYIHWIGINFSEFQSAVDIDPLVKQLLMGRINDIS